MVATPNDVPNIVYATGPRILLVGAHRAFLEALAVRLGAETGLDSVRIAAGPEQVVPMLATGRPDVVVIESDPDTERVAEVVAHVRGVLDTAPVVVMSTFDDADLLAESLLAGARGWVDKEASVDELVHALRIVLADGLWLSPDLLSAALHVLLTRQVKAPVVSFVDRLTRREREVLEHLAAGHSRPEIAEAMSVSPDTVRTHIQNVLKKAEVHSTVAALAKARRSMHGKPPMRRPDLPEPSRTVPRRSMS
jgi:DNA-binding NarL/FixJ family response regulator